MLRSLTLPSSEYAGSHDLTIVSTKFQKRDSHLISFHSGSVKTEIDHILDRLYDQVFRFTPLRLRQVNRCCPARIKVVAIERERSSSYLSHLLPTSATVDKAWKEATEAIIRAERSELGTAKPGRRLNNKQARHVMRWKKGSRLLEL